MDRAASHLPGWIVLGCGLAMFGASLLVPPWLEVRALNWQLDVMRRQAEHLSRQADHYQAFHAALVSDDPVLLERLAFMQLREKPAGYTPLVVPVSQAAGGSVDASALSAGVAGLLLEEGASVDTWLHEPLPREGVDYRAYEPIGSRLIRLTTGFSRVVLLAAGLVFVVAGLVATPGVARPTTRPELRGRSRLRLTRWSGPAGFTASAANPGSARRLRP